MSKETLSAGQANQIISQLNFYLRRTQKELEKRSNTFLEQLSHLWEDQNAVKFAEIYHKSYQNMLKILTINGKSVENVIRSIAARYAQVGGMTIRISASINNLSGEIESKIIKAYFTDSENPDDFGLKDATSNGATEVINLYSHLFSDLDKTFSDLIGAINRINAFGNPEVQSAIARAAGKIVSQLKNNEVTKLKIVINQTLDQTIRDYIAAGKAVTDDFGNILNRSKDYEEYPLPTSPKTIF